jgi:hypothetical protein
LWFCELDVKGKERWKGWQQDVLASNYVSCVVCVLG